MWWRGRLGWVSVSGYNFVGIFCTLPGPIQRMGRMGWLSVIGQFVWVSACAESQSPEGGSSARPEWAGEALPGVGVGDGRR